MSVPNCVRMPEDIPAPRFDRASHMRKDLDFLEAQLREGQSVLVPVWRDMNLVAGDRAALLPLDDARALLDLGGELVWLGKLDAASCFALDVSALPDPNTHPALLGTGAEFKDLRFAAAALRTDEAGLLAYARGIMHWHNRQRHCGVCGERTAPRDGGHVRVCRSEDCKTSHFPRTDPAIIVLVQDGDRCLLGRQHRWPAGMYSTLAGFVEPGETVEQAVAREVFEESGVRIEGVRYVRSQPWPYPSSLMLGFHARATSDEIFVGDDELEDARWFSRAELRESATRDHLVPNAREFFVPAAKVSLAGQLIQDFLEAENA